VPRAAERAWFRAACVAAACATLVLHAAETRTLYRWVDAQGRTQYADKPPAGFKGDVTRVEVDLEANTRPAPAVTPAPARIAPDVLRDVSPPPPDIAKARREKRAKLEAAVRAAQQKVATARAALESGVDPQEGEQQTIQRRYAKAPASKSNCRTVTENNKQSIVCPALAPNAQYYDRQRDLEEALRKAEEELSEAQAAYRRGVD